MPHKDRTLCVEPECDEPRRSGYTRCGVHLAALRKSEPRRRRGSRGHDTGRQTDYVPRKPPTLPPEVKPEDCPQDAEYLTVINTTFGRVERYQILGLVEVIDEPELKSHHRGIIRAAQIQRNEAERGVQRIVTVSELIALRLADLESGARITGD